MYGLKVGENFLVDNFLVDNSAGQYTVGKSRFTVVSMENNITMQE